MTMKEDLAIMSVEKTQQHINDLWETLGIKEHSRVNIKHQY